VAALAEDLAALPRPVDVVVFPAFPVLCDAQVLLAGTGIAFGAQTVHWADRGPWTGEVSVGMLIETGARYVEVGHAERRRYFAEDDETVAAKMRAATHAGLVPLLCAGEQHGDDLSRAVEETLAQVRTALSGAKPGSEVVIAYEPVWAIGARTPASARHVQAVATAIDECLRSHDVRGRLVYGGTAGPGTFTELTRGGATPLDGLFLGRLGHDTASLRNVLQEVGAALPVRTTDNT
jgi:triosephosphate isomerase